MTAGEAARDHLAWVVGAFRGATPDDAELAIRFHEDFLAVVPGDALRQVFASHGAPGFAVTDVTEPVAGTLIGTTTSGLALTLSVETDPPHRIRGLLLRPPAPAPVDDERLADPPVTIEGADDELAAALRQRFADEQHVGLIVAGYRGAPESEVVAEFGWADLEQGEAVTAGHRFPAYSITKLVTVVAVLHLVGGDQVDLDQPVNDLLRAYRLSSDDVTVRELLTHTGGVSSDFPHWVGQVGPAADLLGPVLAVSASERGFHVYSNGGYTTLGQLVADVSGRSYEVFVTEEILRPLRMADSDFPMVPPWPAPGVANGYDVADARIVPAERQVCSVPPAGGLWSTADDLARFALGWPSLLPEALVVEALRPQVDRTGGGSIGLGFLLFDGGWGHAGGGIGYQSSLLCRPASGAVAVAFANRPIPVEPFAFAVLDRVG